ATQQCLALACADFACGGKLTRDAPAQKHVRRGQEKLRRVLRLPDSEGEFPQPRKTGDPVTFLRSQQPVSRLTATNQRRLGDNAIPEVHVIRRNRGGDTLHRFHRQALADLGGEVESSKLLSRWLET